VTYRIVVTATARANAIEAFTWLAGRSPDAAARWYDGLQKAISKLKKMPERYPIAQDESEQLGITLRQMLYGRRKGVYRLFFPSKPIP
jgi:plasmid stabilization system protein ParE